MDISPSIPFSDQDDVEKASNDFADFDYLNRWYPVSWARDIKPMRRTMVEVFDMEYFVQTTRKKDGSVLCFDRDGFGIPATIRQGMVWIFLGEEEDEEIALKNHPIPYIPEVDKKGFTATEVVRDFPIDFSIMVGEILEPENGLLSLGVVKFDVDADDPAAQLSVNEQVDDANGLFFSASGSGYELLLSSRKHGAISQLARQYPRPFKTCTVEFTAPSFIYWKRQSHSFQFGGAINVAFWICPVGVGRCRIMALQIVESIFHAPRWITQMQFNRFLDGGALGMGVHQQRVLDQQLVSPNGKGQRSKLLFLNDNSLHRLAKRVAAFWDATLHRSPNRMANMPSVRPATIVMDRRSQHLAVCPDSQKLVEGCNWACVASRGTMFLLILLKHIASRSRPGSLATRLSSMIDFRHTFMTLVISAMVSSWASSLRNEFTKKKTDSLAVKRRGKYGSFLYDLKHPQVLW